MLKAWTLVLVSAGLLLAACSASQAGTATGPTNPALEDTLPPDVALTVQNRVSELLAVPAENLQIQSVEQMDWPNSCLGLPAGDEVCAEVITPGWLLTFRVDGQDYRYRIDETGTVIRQEP
jgi:hypothetical protein